MNQTTEGFLSSILNDEDLQLMDMAMNEGELDVQICCSWLLVYWFVVFKILFLYLDGNEHVGITTCHFSVGKEHLHFYSTLFGTESQFCSIYQITYLS
jgi:hypothetical protein